MTESSASARSPRVLLIDSDESLWPEYRERFARTAVELNTVATALEGLKHLETESYDAIVLDLITPGPLNGFAVITYLEDEKPHLIDSLFITSAMPEQTIMHAAPNLLPRYYRKPVPVGEIVAAVHAHMAHPGAHELPSPVLVIDDSALDRRLIVEIVHRAGRDAAEVEDGAEAIRQLAVRAFAAVITDLMLPRVDGYSVIRYLREEKPDVLKRTIVVTGMPRPYRDSPLLDTVCAVLEKPVNLSVLRETVAGCLR